MYIPHKAMRDAFVGVTALSAMALGALSEASVGAAVAAAVGCVLATPLRRVFPHALLLAVAAANLAVVGMPASSMFAALAFGVLSCLSPELLLSNVLWTRRVRAVALLSTVGAFAVGHAVVQWTPQWLWSGACVVVAASAVAYWVSCERKFVTASVSRREPSAVGKSGTVALYIGLVGVCLGLQAPFAAPIGVLLGLLGGLANARRGTVPSVALIVVGAALSSWLGQPAGSVSFALCVAGAVGTLDYIHREITAMRRPLACDASLLHGALFFGIAGGAVVSRPGAAIPLAVLLLLAHVLAIRRRTSRVRSRFGDFQWEEFRGPGNRVPLRP